MCSKPFSTKVHVTTTRTSSYLLAGIEQIVKRLQLLTLTDDIKILCNGKEGILHENKIKYEGRLYSSINQFGVYTIKGTTQGSLSERQFSSILFTYKDYSMSYPDVTKHVTMERNRGNRNLEKIERYIRHKASEDKSANNKEVEANEDTPVEIADPEDEVSGDTHLVSKPGTVW